MMYDFKILKDRRYGIFIRDELAAIIACPQACKKIVQILEERASQKNQSEDKITTMV